MRYSTHMGGSEKPSMRRSASVPPATWSSSREMTFVTVGSPAGSRPCTGVPAQLASSEEE